MLNALHVHVTQLKPLLKEVTRILAVEAVVRLGLGWYEQTKIIWALFYDLNNPLVVGQPVTVKMTLNCFVPRRTRDYTNVRKEAIENRIKQQASSTSCT